ncbi:Scr1 family TA system antitoxin-like transcriptional regulator [Streptomyces uncialis]|uniref:helix-turn-helix domain-containing protein n=1 Tax=Streptomyces uncialis TaxID=1048205 RepID=UPI003651D27F
MERDAGRPEEGKSLLAFLGARLRRHRLEKGWSQGKLASLAHTTGAMISYMENAQRVPSADLAHDLDQLFDTDFFAEFLPFVLRYAYPSWFLPFIELERQARRHRVFEAQIIPGLLQTEDYARAMLAPVRLDNVDDVVAARLSRQVLFDRPEPPHTWFILDEQALRRHIGGPEVMAMQLERLLTAGQDPRVVIQVVPDEVPAHPGLAGAFTLLTLDQGKESTGDGLARSSNKSVEGVSRKAVKRPPHDVLYVDGFFQGRTAVDPEEVSAASLSYDLLTSYALPPEASAGRIREHLKGLKR